LLQKEEALMFKKLWLLFLLTAPIIATLHAGDRDDINKTPPPMPPAELRKPPQSPRVGGRASIQIVDSNFFSPQARSLLKPNVDEEFREFVVPTNKKIKQLLGKIKTHLDLDTKSVTLDTESMQELDFMFTEIDCLIAEGNRLNDEEAEELSWLKAIYSSLEASKA